MNIGPGNIEALLLDALEGRLSDEQAAEVWAALEAHPEWGVSWEFGDIELPRLSPDEVPTMDWSGLKKEVVTDTQIRKALRRDRDLHTLDSDVKQSLYRRDERSLWRYWAAAASLALLFWLAWPGDQSTGTAPIAANTETIQIQSTDTTSNQSSSTPAPMQNISTRDTNPRRRTYVEKDHVIIEQLDDTSLTENTNNDSIIEPTQNNSQNIALVHDSTSIEAPLELPFKIQEILLDTTYLAEHIHSNNQQTSPEPLTPVRWIKKKADQILRRAEADGTLPTVRREKESFSLEWGSLSINTH
jgi:hypothetical protein